jgi:hypothetical protein
LLSRELSTSSLWQCRAALSWSGADANGLNGQADKLA